MGNPSEASDAALIADCVGGNRDAFIQRFDPLVSWIVRRILPGRPAIQKDAQEDLRQEVYLALFSDDCRLLRSWRPDGGCRPASWVGMIVRQAALRALARIPPPAIPVISDVEAPPSSPPVSEEASRLGGALARLTHREALCLRLWIEQGLAPGEVAQVLGVSRQTAYQIKDRALAALRLALKKNGNPP